ncbi:glycoside hydrolase family 92 protein [Mucilaginibacter limnophilus]|uniref:Glycoside hydrolase family 92 protein n=1 Tax=Mucilaginibacter limnophilus TaxID=1932778 RepID=A0A3S2V1S8_9SPHI|nr:GH92 family glycosyl hydrolase [Mucilaginibacter limnophilus]RVU00959.1 glycoside hydrolase family 92 protein [Mucilaginibacter limnophilus]
MYTITFLKKRVKNYCLSSLLFTALSVPAMAQNNSGTGNLKYVDPSIGNVGHLLEPTRPTVQLPNQIMRMFPIRKDYIDDQISSFPLLIVSHRLGQVFSIKPSVKSITESGFNSRMTYDHDLEVLRPWYYSTYLIDDDVTVEYVPGKRVGIYQFRFPANSEKSILLSGYNDGAAQWKLTSGTELTGMETYHDDIKVYVYAVLSEKAKFGSVTNNKISTTTEVTGNPAKAWLNFAGNEEKTISLRYAVSFISAEQAKKNYAEELAGTTFAALKASGEEAWAKVMGQINVTGGTEAQKRSFYSALYRCYERPVNINEGGKYYSGYDKKIHQSNRPFYVDDWMWDTYLAHHPLRTILSPEQEGDILNSFVDMYQQSGWMPTFPVLFGDHACMNGFHSTVVFADALSKGLKGFDINKAYEGMRKNATQATMLPWRNGPKGPLEDFYYKNGYYPALHPDEQETDTNVQSFEKRQAVAVTLGTSYDDWALAQIAKKLGKTTDYEHFLKRSFNYKNLWSDKEMLFMPKDAKGNWIDIDPKFDGGMGGRDYYDENNGWTYMWQVQQNIPGLIDLMGGADKFQARLDQLFRESLERSKHETWAKFPDFTGIVGQYSMGNEPSFHIPYLYNYVGAPWKTQKRIRFLLDTWYKDNVFGIPGDEDGGGMTAFVVFSSMGFYPVTPGVPVYNIGSPVFENILINLPNGKQFKLIAKNCSVINKYIQSATINGQQLNSPWFTHEQLVAGGELVLVMGPKPNKQWGLTQAGNTLVVDSK